MGGGDREDKIGAQLGQASQQHFALLAGQFVIHVAQAAIAAHALFGAAGIGMAEDGQDLGQGADALHQQLHSFQAGVL